jgi:hypothetical protein
MKAHFTKTQIGLVPADEASREWYEKVKHGEVVSGEFKKVRNYRFLKKYFALFKIGFDQLEPGEISSKYGQPEKNFDRFRTDCVILAGFYKTTIRLDGSVRVEPKSISFAKMSEDEFSELYSRTIDVLIKHVYDASMTPEEIDRVVMEYLKFA